MSGFTDAEGCFSFSTSVTETQKLKVGVQFKVTQQSSSKEVLYDLKNYFKVGKVYKDNFNALKYQVQDLASIRSQIIPHFEQYPLQTSKALDFKDWSNIVELLYNKKHYDTEGKNLLFDTKSRINNSRSNVERWEYLSVFHKDIKLHPNWVQGFIDGEGSFQFSLSERISRNSKYIAANPTLEIAQSNHDVIILEAIKNFLESGYVKPKFDSSSITDVLNSRSVSRYVTNDEDKVIAFLDNYPLKTLKRLDYEDWKKLIDIKIKGLHKTEEGRVIMKKIKSIINSYRKNSIFLRILTIS